MKHLSRVFGFFPLLAVFILVSSLFQVDAEAGTLVLPSYAATNQVANNAEAVFVDVLREQTVYSASEFPSQPIMITELRWRPDVFAGGPITTTISNIQINLSTTQSNPDGLNSTFAQNTGPDDTVVFSGAMNVVSSFTTLSNGTTAFDIDLILQNPFLFNPTQGNLLLDVRNFTGTSARLFNNSAPNIADSVSRIFDPNNATATVAPTGDSGGGVIQIVYALAETPPTISLQPSNQTTILGNTATFSVSATGVSPLSYQWFLDDTNSPVNSATNRILILTNVQASQIGTYFVQVSNPYGTTSSSNALLTVQLVPKVTIQPISRIVSLGDTATFSVSVDEGSAPASYQWIFNNTNFVTGATNATLSVTNVQTLELGTYSVEVTNIYGAAKSSNATLTVGIVVPNYAISNQLDNNAEAIFVSISREQTVYDASEFPAYPIIIDEIRWRPDVIAGGPITSTVSNIQVNLSTSTKKPDQLDSVFSQNIGADDTVVFSGAMIVDSSFITLSDGTKAFDIDLPLQTPFLFDPSRGNLLIDLHDFTGCGATLYNSSAPGVVDAVSRVFNSSSANATTASASDSGGGVIQVGYIPAPLPPTISSQPTNRTATVGATTTFAIMAGPPPLSYQWFLNDLGNPISGATNSSLTLTNLQTSQTGIYFVQATGTYGTTISSSAQLTVTTDPPSFTSQPTSRSVLAGNSTTFSASAVGSLPLSYQWFFNTNTLIAGATNASLTVTNVQLANAGMYSVQVTNAYGSTNSTNALLAITFPPVVVRLGSTNVMAGSSFDVPVLLVANGVENTLDFSMNFNTQRLAFSGISLGSGAADASLLPNTTQAANGKIGVAVQLPAGETFAAGTQEVVRVTFSSAILSGSQPVVTPVNFTNQPINKLLFDVQGNKMATNFINGSVTLSPSVLEGDVAPRTTGDQSLDIFDWNEVGRMVAGLDVVSNASEFQRADCAPKGTSGDGQLKVTDWVQAGRYGSATDLPSVIGGPTAAVSPTVLTGGPRAVNISAGTTAKGIAVTLPVMLQSQGNENALGFSVNFDPTILKYVSTTKGSAATSSTLVVNTNQAASGVVGVLIALSSGNFSSGAQEVVRLNFTALATTTNGSVTFADQPVIRAISDSAANELSANYTNSTVTVNPPPTLTIGVTNGNATLSWPSWATGFNLQGSLSDLLAPPGWTNVSGATQTNASDISVTVPAPTQGGYFRLQHP